MPGTEEFAFFDLRKIEKLGPNIWIDLGAGGR